MFVTTNLGLAAYLISARKLRYIKTEGHYPQPAEFFFEDKSSQGPAIELSFVNGEALADAQDLLSRVKFLRRTIDAAERKRASEKRADSQAVQSE